MAAGDSEVVLESTETPAPGRGVRSDKSDRQVSPRLQVPHLDPGGTADTFDRSPKRNRAWDKFEAPPPEPKVERPTAEVGDHCATDVCRGPCKREPGSKTESSLRRACPAERLREVSRFLTESTY